MACIKVDHQITVSTFGGKNKGTPFCKVHQQGESVKSYFGVSQVVLGKF